MRLLVLLVLALAAHAASTAAVCDASGPPPGLAPGDAFDTDPGDPTWTRVVDLRGRWRFHVGDGHARAEAAYNDRGWETIFVPSRWEDEGFWGYDGTAWYRRTFRLGAGDLDAPLYLRLGPVDDADQVWINGRFVGSTGRFPESGFETAYFSPRVYRVPPGVLHPGVNVIAIRVYDEQLDGGILKGPVGLFTRSDEPPLALDLAGAWRFRPGGSLRLRDASTAGWAEVTVPAKWEPQGFPDLDNFAWYRRSFTVPDRLRRDDLVLVLGRVDDLHEVYLNGVRVGGTPRIEERYVGGHEWRELRAYALPPDLVRSKNDLAVRVYDGGYEGGIYDGPVGLMTAADFERWRSGGTFLDRMKSLLGLDG